MLVSETVPVRDARCAASGLRGRRDRRRELPLERLWIAQEELADFPGHRIRKNLFPSVFEPVENRVRRGCGASSARVACVREWSAALLAL
jgi:hypothetical protein